jgi:hypothetical protein
MTPPPGLTELILIFFFLLFVFKERRGENVPTRTCVWQQAWLLFLEFTKLGTKVN